MTQVISRRRLASYAADVLAAGGDRGLLLREIAAYLIEMKATRTANLVVAAIEEELQARGIVIVETLSAHRLSNELRVRIRTLVGGRETHFRERINPDVIGGVKITLPDSEFDDTIQRKLIALKGAK